MNRIIQAKMFAEVAHGQQKYGDGLHMDHVEDVASLVRPFAPIWGENAEIIAYLHDVVEDTAVTIDDIDKNFGQFIAQCVGYLTDEPGKSRRLRKRLSNAKLALISEMFEVVLLVKPADRFSNVRACVRQRKQGLWEMYANEHVEFRKAVYRPGLCDDLWKDLDFLMVSWPDAARILAKG